MMVKMSVRTLRLAATAAFLLVLPLAGCGVEITDDEGGGDTANPPLWQSAGVHYADTAITSLALVISPEFSSPTLVDIYARLEDQWGDFVYEPRLNQYNYTIVEGGRFVDMNQVPYPDLIQGLENRMYVLAIDSSGSMLEGVGEDPTPTKMDVTRTKAKEFASAAVGTAGATCAVVDFDDDARLVQKLTSDTTAIDAAIDSLAAGGNTAIGDALVISASQIGARPGRGAIVLITDGENTSGRTPDEASLDIQKYGLPVYAIGIGISNDPLDTVHYNATVVSQITKVTADTEGQAYFVPDPTSGLTSTFAAILARVPPMHDAYRLHVPLLRYSPGTLIPVTVTVRYQNVYGTHEASSGASIEIPSLF